MLGTVLCSLIWRKSLLSLAFASQLQIDEYLVGKRSIHPEEAVIGKLRAIESTIERWAPTHHLMICKMIGKKGHQTVSSKCGSNLQMNSEIQERLAIGILVKLNSNSFIILTGCLAKYFLTKGKEKKLMKVFPAPDPLNKHGNSQCTVSAAPCDILSTRVAAWQISAIVESREFLKENTLQL
jgi:hypothetical protein